MCHGFDGTACVGEGLKNGGLVESSSSVGGFEPVIETTSSRFGSPRCERGSNWV